MKKNISLLLALLIGSFVFSQNVNLNIGSTKQKKYYEKLAIEFIKNKIIIPVEIQGKVYRFILDTGAPNIISKEIQGVLNPKLLESIPITDINEKKERLNVVLVKSLKLGSVIFENTASLVYDFNASPIFKCFNIDGFIGSNMLRNSIIQIDKKKRVLVLTDGEKKLTLNKKKSSKIKFVDDQSSPYLWVDLKGADSGKELLLIDLGADDIYGVSRKNYSILEKKQIFNVLGESVGASSLGLFGDVSKNSQYKLLLPTLKINNTELKNIITETTNDNNSKIGSKLLDFGVMTINYKNKRFYFKPYSNNINTLHSDYGFSRTLKNNKVIVGFVWDEKLKSKMAYGDEIIEINGVKINQSKICDLITGNLELENKKTITLKIKSIDGTITELKAEKTTLN